MQYQRTKHIEIDIHFVREKVQMGEVRVHHIPATSHYANIFTKELPTSLFNSFRSSLGVNTIDHATAGWGVGGGVSEVGGGVSKTKNISFWFRFSLLESWTYPTYLVTVYSLYIYILL